MTKPAGTNSTGPRVAIFLTLYFASTNTLADSNNHRNLSESFLYFIFTNSIVLQLYFALRFFTNLKRGQRLRIRLGNKKVQQGLIICLFSALALWSFLSLLPIEPKMQLFRHVLQVSFFSGLGYLIHKRIMRGVSKLQTVQREINADAVENFDSSNLRTSDSLNRKEIMKDNLVNSILQISNSSILEPDEKIIEIKSMAEGLHKASVLYAMRASTTRSESLFKRARTRLLYNSLRTNMNQSRQLPFVAFLLITNAVSLLLENIYFSIVIGLGVLIVIRSTQRIFKRFLSKSGSLSVKEFNLLTILLTLLFLVFIEISFAIFNRLGFHYSGEIKFEVWLISILIMVGIYIIGQLITFSVIDAAELKALEFEKLNVEKYLAIKLTEEDFNTHSQFSRVVHGPIQGHFMRKTANLESSPAADEIATIQSIFMQRENSIMNREQIENEILSSVAEWKSILDIELTVDISEDNGFPKVYLNQIRNLCLIIEDAILNSYRHGAATRVEASLEIDAEGYLILQGKNNGQPFPSEATRSGLGFVNFYRVFGNGWEILNENGLVVFRGAAMLAAVPNN